VNSFSSIRRKRAKVRPGRLRGEALEQLRRECFERDLYRCQAVHEFLVWNGDYWVICSQKCLRVVTWDGPNAGHMAHKRNKRMYGDSLNQVQTECSECHNEYHAYGPSRTKPCPTKLRIEGLND
jgi:hypothetical protein